MNMTTHQGSMVKDRFSLLGRLAQRSIKDPEEDADEGSRRKLQPSSASDRGVRGVVTAEELFLSSCVSDEDPWLQFQVEEEVAACEQLPQLATWLHAHRPSQVLRSQGVGWIAVKLRDKGKKVLEAKAAWDSHVGEKTMAVVNGLATQYNIGGGKWMCHLARDSIDQVFDKVARALLGGSLGKYVYMVKVPPVEDVNPAVSRGDHVLVIYNNCYTDTQQVMRVENRLRSVGLYLPLSYKPDVFSALGIYRNNKWGFRPTIYTSRVILAEGRSRVEAVGTGKWYYNSAKGLQWPDEEELEVEEYQDLLIQAALVKRHVAEEKLGSIDDCNCVSIVDHGVGRNSGKSSSSKTVKRGNPSKSCKKEPCVLTPTTSEVQPEWLAKLAELKLHFL